METTDYAGGFIYKDHHLDHILTGEGRLKWNDDDKVFYAEYFIKDHLGNIRSVITTDPGMHWLAQGTDYYPFGLEIYIYGYSDHNQLKYNAKELQTEADIIWYDYGARFYDPQLGRFHTIDRFAEKYADMSTYQYGANNPIKFVDINGDSAWTITNQWSKEFIQKYSSYVKGKTEEYYRNDVELTCEDLVLSTLIDFASENNLPLKIINNSGEDGALKIFDAASDDYTNVGTFKNDILKTTAAKDLQNNSNTTPIEIGAFGARDIMLNRNSDNIATHVQLGVSRNDFVIGIMQGNSGWLNTAARHTTGRGVPGASNPKSFTYTGTTPEKAIYVHGLNLYKNYTTGRIITNFNTVRNIETRRWNFSTFNR